MGLDLPLSLRGLEGLWAGSLDLLPAQQLPSPLPRGRVGVGGVAGLQSDQRGVALSISSCFTLAHPEKVVPALPSTRALAAPQAAVGRTGGAPGNPGGSGLGRPRAGRALPAFQLPPKDGGGGGDSALQKVLESPSCRGTSELALRMGSPRALHRRQRVTNPNGSEVLQHEGKFFHFRERKAKQEQASPVALR